jgi:hypothetical protein
MPSSCPRNYLRGRKQKYLSINSSYTPWSIVLRATLPRAILQARLRPPLPLSLNDGSSPFSPGFLDPILAAFVGELTPRPGLRESFEILRDEAGAEVWAATNGGAQFTRDMFLRTIGRDATERLQVFSCDQVRAAKTDPKFYAAVMEEIGKSNTESGEKLKPWCESLTILSYYFFKQLDPATSCGLARLGSLCSKTSRVTFCFY